MLQGATLWELIDERVAATPDAEMAVDESGRRMTFAEFKERSERVAAALAARGIAEGDVVTWQLPTWFESMILVAALSRLGATQNPILHIYREREVGFCVRQTGAKLLVVPPEFPKGVATAFDFPAMAEAIAADLASEGGQVDVLVCDRELPEADPSNLPAPPTDGTLVRWLFYTSGTTADPKGAQHTDQTIAAVSKGMSDRLAITEVDRNALAFPFPHIGGITWLFSSLQYGLANICFQAFVPDQVISVLDAEGVTLAGSGTVFHQVYLAAQQKAGGGLFTKVRGFPGGGAPKPPALHYEMKEAFPGSAGILSGYGLTEAPILTMSGVNDSDEDLANTDGMPMPGVELKLVKLDGMVAGVGEEGEVRAKAPQLMLGYLDASLDAEAFDDEGYFRTGDLGVLNERNMLAITGRLKDVIIRKGENVSAKEVEDHLYKHPKVADVAVIGLPDGRSGERVCAVVAVKEGEGELDFIEMVEFLKTEGLMVQKIPEQLEHEAVIPRNPAGKILKRDLQAKYEGSEPDR
ncbi:MAG: AMP-binding protein [Actinobacteria bacterium]|nr:AMP-binding protein [Actinomycetota bacterium]